MPIVLHFFFAYVVSGILLAVASGFWRLLAIYRNGIGCFASKRVVAMEDEFGSSDEVYKE
jgi:hypothetical protein